MMRAMVVNAAQLATYSQAKQFILGTSKKSWKKTIEINVLRVVKSNTDCTVPVAVIVVVVLTVVDV